MRRSLVAALAALPLTVGVAVAQAHDGDNTGIGNGHALVAGTVVSVDATNGTFVANAFVVQPQPGDGPGDHNGGNGGDNGGTTGGDNGGTTGGDNGGTTGGDNGGGDNGGSYGNDVRHDGNQPATTQVTISTDANTEFHISGQPGSISDLTPGQRVYAFFNGSSTDPIQTLVANPALAVYAKKQRQEHQLYAFVGSVTAADTTAGTVTVEVTRSLPSGLVPSGSGPVSFTVGPDTLVLGGTSSSLFGGSLSDVSVGDIVAGGVIAPAGETLAQIEATPLRVLLDLPAGTSTTSSAPQVAKAKDRALKRALALLGHKSKKSKKAKSHKKSHKSHKRHGHSKKK